ncbi:surface antigen BspA-like [Trichomonas vaginalis G3]|uniref:Surface antigen BspA-like n=1 Tax=Trichomonas vaginalis (strain ATCC PRA-98 / G3) TaxID=412133 RepID=A2FMR0_TRIV3|nr:leucine-rich repeats (6 copies)-containing protein [Trichomonas vaginalis G3]EAX93817.1 surface antigen BspA-like [Trichomonas vaginalis G3]KAI5486344.1 leucine-rich repeats (6 copies)-containing protein [Trichomonas vaginalis G3]|eukprot:XP_001306747.1 surface antigen BspA-like [Trichomonas vaginalis G3]
MKTSFKFSPETTIIGDNAFSECHLSGTFTISKNIATTDDGFLIGIRVDKIYLEKESKLTTIVNWIWATSLKYVFLTKRVNSITESAFYSCHSLTTIEFEEGSELTSINSYAFSETNLSNFTFPPKCTSVGYSIFNLDSSLNYVYIPASLTNIDTNTFTGSPNIQKIEIDRNNPMYTVISSATLMSKDRTKFLYVSPSETSFTIPSSVSEFGKTMFQSCQFLTSIDVESFSTTFSAEGGIVYNKDFSTAIACIGGITSITLNSRCQHIGDFCLYKCTKINSVRLNNGLLTLGNSAFYSDNFTYLDVPSSVKTIDPSTVFCGSSTRHTPSNTCSDIIETNIDFAIGIQHQIKNNVKAQASLFFIYEISIGFW